MLTFWRNGYHGTSLDGLVAATGASRASLYAIFGDKKAMLIQALDLYAQRFKDRVDQAMRAGPKLAPALRLILIASVDRFRDAGRVSALQLN